MTPHEARLVAIAAVEEVLARRPVPSAVTLKQAAEMLGISPNTARKLKLPRNRAGLIPYEAVLAARDKPLGENHLEETPKIVLHRNGGNSRIRRLTKRPPPALTRRRGPNHHHVQHRYTTMATAYSKGRKAVRGVRPDIKAGTQTLVPQGPDAQPNARISLATREPLKSAGSLLRYGVAAFGEGPEPEILTSLHVDTLKLVRTARASLSEWLESAVERNGDLSLAYDAEDVLTLVETVLAAGLSPSTDHTISPIRGGMEVAARLLEMQEART